MLPSRTGRRPDTTDPEAVQLQRGEPLAEQSYKALREEIATGTLTPGQRITERSLAFRLGVSPTPVREALRRLEQEGLIAHSGPRTLSVVAHSEQALRELMFAEVVLRAAEVRSTAVKITGEQLQTLQSIVDEMCRLADTATDTELLELAGRFDQVLSAAAASPGVRRLIDSTAVIGLGRRLLAVGALRSSARSLGRQHIEAHQELVRALRDHDPDRAETILRHHLLSSLELLLTVGANGT